MLTLAPALALSLHAIFAKPQIIPAAASPEPPTRGPAQRGPDFRSVFAQTRHPEAGLPTQDASGADSFPSELVAFAQHRWKIRTKLMFHEDDSGAMPQRG